MQRHLAAAGVLLTLFFAGVGVSSAPASSQDAVAPKQDRPTARDGSHDFDWDIGVWKTHQKRLLHPLTGSTTWVEYQGTDDVRRIWDGANAGLIEADGPSGHLEIYTLRLYNPDAHQWSVNFANKAGGAMSIPSVGEFRNGRADFYDQETYNGRAILLRFSIS